MASVRVDWIKIDGVISKIRFELFDVFRREVCSIAELTNH